MGIWGNFWGFYRQRDFRQARQRTGGWEKLSELVLGQMLHWGLVLEPWRLRLLL